MVEFKDLAGLSEPLKRLIEVIAEGIGGISKPILVRKNADAKAYEIKVVAKAISESQKLLGPVKYDGGEIIIESDQNKNVAELPEVEFDKRVVSRMAYQEAKRQDNIEKITQYAAGAFDGNEEMGSERPESNWTARFFRIAEDISTEEMQTLWGKVLAGEVKRPGSYSLRTLDVLKNISQAEAETFVRVARLAFYSGGKAFVPNRDHEKYLKEHFNITFLDLLLLREIGLLAPSDLEFSLSPAEKDDQTVMTCGSTCVLIERPAGIPKQPIKAVVFTEIGKQLLQLVDRTPAEPQYIEKFASFFQNPGVIVKSGTIVQWLDDEFTYTGLHEVPGNKPKPETK